MFESLVIVTREGVEAALVLAIVIAYLKRSGRERLAPWVYGGVAAAIVLSVVAAFLVPNINTVSETVEGWALLAGAICVTSLVIWMQHAGRSMKKEIEAGLSRVSDSATGGAAGWGMFLFAALLVGREGFETVLFLVAISFNTAGLARLLGAGLGLAVAGVFGYLLLRGTVRVNLKRFFTVTTSILVVLSAQLVVGAYHEFAEAGYLPASKTSMALVGPLVRYDSIVFGVAVLLVLFLVGKTLSQTGSGAATTDENPAERRRRIARERRERWARRATAVAAATVILILATGFLTQAQVPAQASGTPVTLQEGTVLLPTAALADGHAHYFRANLDGHAVRFFAIKRPAGDYVACFDACEICGDKGYYEEAGGMTCRNCTAPINLATLGRTGGCNPVPLASSVEGANLVIRQADLVGGEKRFPATR